MSYDKMFLFDLSSNSSFIIYQIIFSKLLSEIAIDANFEEYLHKNAKLFNMLTRLVWEML